LQAVWPDTHVTEDALTRSVSHLRRILEDDPHNSRFIKTIPKVGYCLLVAPLYLEGRSAAVSEAPAVSPEMPAGQVAELPAGSQVAKRSHRYGATVLGLAAGLVVLAVGLAFWTKHLRRMRTAPLIRTSQLTTNAGEQSSPA